MGFLERIGLLEPDFDHEWARGERERMRLVREQEQQELQTRRTKAELAARTGCPCHSCFEMRAEMGITRP